MTDVSPAADPRRGDLPNLQDAADFLLPIVVAVTGHTDLDPRGVGGLERAVQRIFLNLVSRYPSSPIVLLSALAEGADQLVADVFLRMFEGDPRHRLLVTLPLPVSTYRGLFSSAEAERRFLELLEQGEISEVPAGHTRSGSTVQQALGFEESRYRSLGAFLACHAQIMIALWDGVTVGKAGGTSEVVSFRLEGLPAELLPNAEPLDPPEHGPVYHVMAPRSGAGSVADAGSTRLLFPRQWGRSRTKRRTLELMLQQIDNFNSDALPFLRKQPSRVLASMRRLVNFEGDRSPVALGAIHRRILRVYSVADALAVHNERHSQWALLFLVGLSMLAVFMNQWFSNVEASWVLQAYFVILLAAPGLSWAANRLDWQKNHFNYRALAEGLRVQFFWQTAGVSGSVADNYLRAQRDELYGIRLALRSFELSISGERSSIGLSGALEVFEFVHRSWIVSQRHYFLGVSTENGYVSGVVSRDGRWKRGIEGIAKVLYGVALATLGATVGCGFEVVECTWPPEQFRHPLLTLSGTLFGVAIAIAGYGKIMGFAEHARMAEKMGALFQRAEVEMARVLEALEAGGVDQSALDHGRDVLLDIGREALAENADWLILHRARPWEFTVH